MTRPSPAPGELLDAALAARGPLLADPLTTVGRIFNGVADGLDGLVLERLGDVLIAQLHEGRLSLAEPEVRELCATAAQRVGAKAVYRKVFPKDRNAARAVLERLHTDPEPWIGTPAEGELSVREHGLTFRVRPYDGYATGLFLDHRANRVRVRALAADCRVLNAFAYTCAYTVAAAAGGARETVSVDISRKSLEWGRRNLAANDVAEAAHQMVCADVLDYCRRAARHDRKFDLIILDPPTFSRTRRPTRVFAIEHDLGRLVDGALRLLDTGGLLLLSVNHRETSFGRMEGCVREAAAAQQRHAAEAERLPLPQDFRGDPDHAKSILVRVD